MNSRGAQGQEKFTQSGRNEQGEDQRFKGIFRLKSEIQTFFPAKTGDLRKKKVFTEILRDFATETGIQTVFPAENKWSGARFALQ